LSCYLVVQLGHQGFQARTGKFKLVLQFFDGADCPSILNDKMMQQFDQCCFKFLVHVRCHFVDLMAVPVKFLKLVIQSSSIFIPP